MFDGGIITFLMSPVFGSVIGNVASYFNKKEERHMQEAKWQHEHKMTQLTAQNKREELQLEGDLADKKLEGEAFVEGVKDKGGWMENTRAIIRPILTVYLVMLATWITYQLHTLVGGLDNIPMDQVFTMYWEIISAIVFLTVTCVTYWFNQRPSQAIKYMRENVGGVYERK